LKHESRRVEAESAFNHIKNRHPQIQHKLRTPIFTEMPVPMKKVRFARTSTVHVAPTPPTPALSLGSLSPRSSSGPLTPPSYAMALPGPTPYAVPYNIKTQSGVPRTVRLHTLLRFSYSPVLNWDLTLHPSTISTQLQGLSRQALAEPATNPPVKKLSVRSPHLPWIIKVTASRDDFITVGDILETIFRTLRANVGSQEFHALPSPKEERRVTAAYEQRYRRIRDSREYEDEKRGGVKRVDFLMGHTAFNGLSPTTHGPDVWALNTS
jgi:hypothetical protein